AIIGGVIFGSLLYVFGYSDGKYDAELKTAKLVTLAIQNRAGINETIDNMNRVTQCVELSGLREQYGQVRGRAEDLP
ncbi:hypothetical protein NSX25_23205, partial [Salmonella enterica]|nr:hypothetical protein [Salmonella enterica]